MNANPDWLIPAVGKQESAPYDILIDLIPWYVPGSFIVVVDTTAH